MAERFMLTVARSRHWISGDEQIVFEPIFRVRSYKSQQEVGAMYCPRCAAQNPDDAKFCRACGTNLETVALALSDEYRPAKQSKGKGKVEKTAKSWPEKRSESVKEVVEGAGLLAASILIGVALGLFSNQPDWIIIWLVFVGWMACWGVISLVSGIGGVLEARFMLRQGGQTGSETDTQEAQLPSANNPAMLPERSAAHNLFPTSVTEHTTEPLIKQPPTSKRAN
jgi:zinc-ribbon domain